MKTSTIFAFFALIFECNLFAVAVPQKCALTTSSDTESYFTALVAEVTRKGSRAELQDANRCLWEIWPQRDGALGAVLVANFLYMADREPSIFFQQKTSDASFQELLMRVREIGFVAGSKSEHKYLNALRNSLLKQTDRFVRTHPQSQYKTRAILFKKAISEADLRIVE
jgi:hypothetical protein